MCNIILLFLKNGQALSNTYFELCSYLALNCGWFLTAYHVMPYVYVSQFCVVYHKNSLMLMLYCNNYTVLTKQSKVTVIQSDDNQPGQDNKSSQVDYTSGLYISTCL